jgi:predicted pyridoxine 5'-phosphate oxidase superfamily flavin-nucleotide-binding protein
MPYRYLTELTTPSVEAAQQRYGSRTSMRRLAEGLHTDSRLGSSEAEFISERDGFYLATVGETGWPYIQHRGGPPGFLRLLEGTGPQSVLGWADFRGNRQYLSMGNLGASPRVSLFLMDYAAQLRLKILGTARVLDVRDGGEAADLAERLTVPGYDARVERVVTVDVHSFDWNCPQHITPRWTQTELTSALEPLHAELEGLRAENRRLRGELDAPAGGRPGRSPSTAAGPGED